MSDGWYVSRGGKVLGPYTWEGVLEYARVGMIAVEDMVMRPGSEEWVRADAVPAFFAEDAPTAPASAPAAAVLPEPSASPAASEPPAVVPPASAKRGSLTLVSVLAAAFVLGVAVFILVPFVFAGTGTSSSASVSNGGPAAWWSDRIDGTIASVTGGGGGPGDGVTDMLGMWVSTTPGKGFEVDANVKTDDQVLPIQVAFDVEMVIERMEGNIAVGTMRMFNASASAGGQSYPLPDNPAVAVRLKIDGDTVTDTSDSAWGLKCVVEGDRLMGTVELPAASGVLAGASGTMDLTRSQ